MSNYTFNGLTISDVDRINNLPDGTTIVFRNTVGIDKNAIVRIKPSIVVRVIGGLDEVEKPKFNTPKYYARTLYKPMEIYKIIEKMESIEKGIKPGWNDIDKAMYIYKQMCENMKYDHIDVNIGGRDWNRNLLGFLRGMSVCAGFSMMYKEMMERQGIRCIYQNKQHGHAWNLVELNGKLVPVDLTFDIGIAEDANKCTFQYFGTNTYFFNDPNHIATDEEIPQTSFLTRDEFQRSYEKVVEQRRVESDTKSFVNPRGKKIYYHIIPEGKYNRCILYCDGKMKSVLYDSTIKEDDAVHYDYFLHGNDFFVYTADPNSKEAMDALNNNCIFYYRDDGTSFFLRKSDETIDPHVIGHDYLSFDDSLEGKVVSTKLYSEDNLIIISRGLREGVANVLLSRRRVSEKAARFKGYVGYIGMEKGRFQKYSVAETEERISGIRRF